MEESRDPAIRLFGKMIPLRPGGEAPVNSGEEGGGEVKEDLVIIEATPDSKDHVHDSTNPQDKSEPATSSNPVEAQNPSADQDALLKTSKPEEQQNSTSKSQDETPKKPDKLLPCPRCRSLDTKFCYFNNYNVNQPRHFCKNCQRYWTAGGTMRNVPVGAGRRKNKGTTSHYRSITVSDNITVSDAILQTVRHDAPEPINHPPPKPDGTVLSFSSDAPLRETMASVLEAAEKTMQNRSRNGFHQTEQQMPHHPVVENYDEHSSSISTSSSTSDRNGANSQQPATLNHQGFSPQIPYFNGSPWPCHWTPAPPFSASSFPIAFYPPAAYWGCAVPGAWSIPWISPRPSFPNCDSAGVAPNSPTLGKHSREADVFNTLDQSKQERSLWIPKTTRIDTSGEAATSSIWTTMGFENDKAGTSSGRGIFRAFHEKDIVKNHMEGASPVLHANPAALSRSLTFRENS